MIQTSPTPAASFRVTPATHGRSLRVFNFPIAKKSLVNLVAVKGMKY